MMVVFALALGHEIPENSLNLPQSINPNPIIELPVEMIQPHLLFDKFLDRLIPFIDDLMRFHPMNALNQHPMG